MDCSRVTMGGMSDAAELSEPTFDDVERAAERMAADLPPTPQWNYPALDAEAEATIVVKHENIQPTGAFKVRGGLTFFANQRASHDDSRGVIAFSTGNHAQSMAFAARQAGVRCVIAMPEGANEAKVRAARALGAEVELAGMSLGESKKWAEELAARDGLRMVSPGDEPDLITGVGTLYRELFTAQPELDAVIVPVGSGSGAAAACIVAEALAPSCEIIGVQSTSSPAAHDSWHAGELLERPNQTAVEGLATGHGFALPQQIMRRRMADFLLVTDEQIAGARRLLATHAHTLAEGAGAAALAAVLTDDRFAGRPVGIVCTGGNASSSEIATLSAPESR